MRAIILALCLCGVAAAGEPDAIYTVSVVHSKFKALGKEHHFRNVVVRFDVVPEDQEVIEKIVRQSVETAAMLDPKLAVLGSAWDSKSTSGKPLMEDELEWDSESKKVWWRRELLGGD